MPNPPDDLVTTIEACDILGGLDRSTLVRWIHAGRIEPARKLPGKTGSYLLRRADVENLRKSA
jgi:excisionase family DNA binding protein